MVILISGATHTGKTLLAQRLLEKEKFPYLSLDHLKMGLIRSGYTKLTPEASIETMTAILWPIVVGIIKTNIENKQNIIIEGSYIPFDYQKSFSDEYLKYIKYKCIIFSESYCRKYYHDIIDNANLIEDRTGHVAMDKLITENLYYLNKCKQYNLDYIFINDKYHLDLLI